MKSLLALCLLVSATQALADAPPAAATPAPVAPAAATSPAPVLGEVLEVKESMGFTYLRLKTRDGEVWAAVARAPVKVGMFVSIGNVMPSENFVSKSLKQTFPKLLFGTLAGVAGDLPEGAPETAAPAPAKVDASASIHVAKASGANAYTVAEIIAKGKELKDKQVRVRGRIVKYNPNIMKKNWIHVRDGSGSDAEGNNDILVTSGDQAMVDDVVTVQGIVRTEMDFGSGYAYQVMIEEATLQP